jgi:Malectin domain
MDFYIEDQLVLNDFDVVAAAGGSLRAYVVTIAQPIFITDGGVTITMSASTNTAIISAVEVIASANLVTHRINCGATSKTPVIMDNMSWSRDAYALSGALSNRCGTTTTNSIYCVSRYFATSIGTPLRYSIPVPYNKALYAVRLHFNEQVNTRNKYFHIYVLSR